jgi:ferredoxin
MRISVERDSCIASGSCSVEAPDLFDQDDDGFVVVRQERPPADLADAARKAKMACPVAAITIDEDA